MGEKSVCVNKAANELHLSVLYCIDAALWVSVFIEEVLKHKGSVPSLWTFFFNNRSLVKKFQRLNSSGSSTVFHPLLVYVPVTYRAGVFAQVGEGNSFWMRDWELPSHLCSPYSRGLSLSEQCPRARPGRCVCHVQFAMYGRFTVSIQEALGNFFIPCLKEGLACVLQDYRCSTQQGSTSAARDALHCHKVNPRSHFVSSSIPGI